MAPRKKNKHRVFLFKQGSYESSIQRSKMPYQHIMSDALTLNLKCLAHDDRSSLHTHSHLSSRKSNGFESEIPSGSCRDYETLQTATATATTQQQQQQQPINQPTQPNQPTNQPTNPCDNCNKSNHKNLQARRSWHLQFCNPPRDSHGVRFGISFLCSSCSSC